MIFVSLRHLLQIAARNGSVVFLNYGTVKKTYQLPLMCFRSTSSIFTFKLNAINVKRKSFRHWFTYLWKGCLVDTECLWTAPLGADTRSSSPSINRREILFQVVPSFGFNHVLITSENSCLALSRQSMWLCNILQRKVQNRGIRGHTKRTHVLQIFFSFF